MLTRTVPLALIAIAALAFGLYEAGVVQASTLEMADVGATIADGGRRPLPTMVFGAKPHFVRSPPRRSPERSSG